MTHSHDGRSTATHSQPDALLPIREVSRLTGINPVTLRAWERRYGLITPTRTEGGHRLYSQADIATVRSIMGWIERGTTVSKIGRILAASRDMEGPAQGSLTVIDSAGRQGWQHQLRQAVNDFDEHRLGQLYDQVYAIYPLPVLYEDVLMPIWRDYAARENPFGQVSEWLFLDRFLRARVHVRELSSSTSAARRVVLAAMPEACRALELMVAGLLMTSEGVRVTVLALSQPLEELNRVCSRMKPDALALFSNRLPSSDTARRLVLLGLGVECPVLVAGELAELIQDELRGSAIACLGNSGVLMQKRLQQFLAGQLDT